jgi:malate dehydrogenase
MAAPRFCTVGIKLFSSQAWSLICGQPCQCNDGEYSVVEGLEITDFSRERIDASVDELRSERAAVSELGLV